MRSPSASATSGPRDSREAEGTPIACAPGWQHREQAETAREEAPCLRPPRLDPPASFRTLLLRLSLPFFRTLSPLQRSPTAPLRALLLHRPGPRGCFPGCPPCRPDPLLRPPRPTSAATSSSSFFSPPNTGSVPSMSTFPSSKTARISCRTYALKVIDCVPLRSRDFSRETSRLHRPPEERRAVSPYRYNSPMQRGEAAMRGRRRRGRPRPR